LQPGGCIQNFQALEQETRWVNDLTSTLQTSFNDVFGALQYKPLPTSTQPYTTYDVKHGGQWGSKLKVLRRRKRDAVSSKGRFKLASSDVHLSKLLKQNLILPFTISPFFHSTFSLSFVFTFH
jgi:hypothetical protein